MHKRALKRINHEPHPSQETPPAFGILLKEERLQQGISLEKISRITGIKLCHLLAIEEGARRNLPADAFNRGFIRLYAKELGISPEKSLTLYEKQWGFSNGMRGAKTFLSGEHMAETKPLLADRQVLTFIAIVVLVATVFLTYNLFLSRSSFSEIFFSFNADQKETTDISSEIRSSQKKLQSKVQPGTQPQTTATETDTLFISPETGLSGSESSALRGVQTNLKEAFTLPDLNLQKGLPTATNQQENVTPPTQKLETKETLKPNIVEDNANKKAPTQNESGKATPGPAVKPHQKVLLPQETPEEVKEFTASKKPNITNYTLNAFFIEKTWLRIQLDSGDSKEYIFHPGDKRIWEASEKINLFVGNAGGIELSLNGVPLPLDKPSGQTMKLTIP